MLDTSIVIDALRGSTCYEPGKVSALPVVEVLRGIPEEKRAAAKALLEEAYSVVGITNNVMLDYCRLYDSSKEDGCLLPDADLIIAASALAEGEPILTKDDAFRHLEKYGLRLVLK